MRQDLRIQTVASLTDPAGREREIVTRIQTVLEIWFVGEITVRGWEGSMSVRIWIAVWQQIWLQQQLVQHHIQV